MPALDECHPPIARALQKEGWIVNEKPERISTANRSVYIDIKASRQTNGMKNQILLAEVKCFFEDTNLELFIAVGNTWSIKPC